MVTAAKNLISPTRGNKNPTYAKMIHIQKSKTADTRTCDPTTVSKDVLLESSRQHIADVGKALAFLGGKLTEAASVHDYDKLAGIDWFHQCFVTGFADTGWWDNHRRIHRHHLGQEDGIPDDVNLLDVLEYIADCVTAGMARSGSVYDLEVDADMLTRAFHNTVDLLKSQVVVRGEFPDAPPQEDAADGQPSPEVMEGVDRVFRDAVDLHRRLLKGK